MAIYARFQASVVDKQGNVVPNAHIEVRSEVPGQPLAALKADRTGAGALTNPFDADANGFFAFHVAGGAYKIRAYLGPPGAPTFEAEPWRYVPIGLNAESDSITQKTQREVTLAGDVVIAVDDADEIYIAKTVPAATRAVLPLSSARPKPVRIVDGNRDAATNNISVVPSRPDTVTVTIASPAVFTRVAHGLAVNQPVSLETSGALPTGLAADTQYYIKTVPTADSFTLAATPGGAAINTSGGQSGTHKMGTDTIMGGAIFIIDSNGGSLEVGPRAGGVRGWF